MNISFRLVDFHPRTGSLQVIYHNDDLPEGVTFSLTVPLSEGRYLEGQALEDFVRSFAPQDIFERAAEAKRLGLVSPIPTSSAPRQEVDAGRPREILSERQLFVVEDNQRVLLNRPLVQLSAFDIPVEVL